MASGALFGSTAGRSQSRNLVEFKAGKMYMNANTVHPDKRKGLVYIYQSDDSLIHFCWKDRSKSSPEDDLIIFPDDCYFKKIPAPTSGRIYLLRFKSSNKKYMFWMQEPQASGDDDLCRKVNDSLTNPPARTSSSSQLTDLAAGLGGDADLNNLLGNMSQQQLLQLLGGMGGLGGPGGGLSSLLSARPSSTQSDSSPPSRIQSSPGSRPSQQSQDNNAPPRPVTAAALPPGPASQPVQLQDLQNILSGLADIPGEEHPDPVDLMLGLTPDVLLPILANPQVQAQLIPHLPDGEDLPKTEAELRATIRTPQFRQAVQSLVAALSTGQLGALMHQFGLGEAAINAANAGDVEAFIRAIQDAEKKK